MTPRPLAKRPVSQRTTSPLLGTSSKQLISFIIIIIEFITASIVALFLPLTNMSGILHICTSRISGYLANSLWLAKDCGIVSLVTYYNIISKNNSPQINVPGSVFDPLYIFLNMPCVCLTWEPPNACLPADFSTLPAFWEFCEHTRRTVVRVFSKVVCLDK